MMIVLDIQKFKGSTWSVELAGGGLAENMKIYLHQSIVCELEKGMQITEQQADGLMRRNDVRRAKERGLYLMESREYSFKGLYQKLLENYPEDICLEVCQRLAELGIINDRRYAERLCRQLVEGKKLGKYRVKNEMRLKGLTNEVIDETLKDFAEEDNPIDRLGELIEQKYERYLVDEKGVQKVKNALARKGYSYGEIKAALDLYDLDFDE